MRRLTTEEFIQRAKNLNGDRYDYSKVEYVGSQTKVTIICSKHGDFKQVPQSHLKGVHCKECAIVKRANIRRSSTDEFVIKARKIHGEKYSYDKVEYISNHELVIITCPIHGDFTQEPAGHLTGYGCRKCANVEQSGINTEKFIQMVKKLHGDR